jgi:hypothetical protein
LRQTTTAVVIPGHIEDANPESISPDVQAIRWIPGLRLPRKIASLSCRDGVSRNDDPASSPHERSEMRGHCYWENPDIASLIRATFAEVLAKAKAAAGQVKTSYAVFVTESAGRTWSGLDAA